MTNEVLKQSYFQLQKELARINNDREKVIVAINALKPLINGVEVNDKSDNEERHGPIRWKNKCIEFFNENIGRWILSPEILDEIKPTTDPETRRNRMASVSITLAALVKAGLIQSEENPDGRGLRYKAPKKIVLE